MNARAVVTACWRRSLVAAALFAACRSVAPAQVEASRRLVEDKLSTVYFDAISFATPDSSKPRLDVFVQVGYRDLTFVKQGDLYFASYEASISLYDSAGALVGEKVWTENINGVPFEQSTSTSAHRLAERSFPVAPGQYQVAVSIRDVESKISQRIVRRILVSDYTRKPFMLSDIMLVSHVTVNNGTRSIVPDLTGNLGTLTEPFYAFFEAYDHAGVDSVRYTASILDSKGGTAIRIDTLTQAKPGKNEVLMKIDQRNLPLGDYRLEIRALAQRSGGAADSVLAETNRTFIMRWRGVPVSVKDLDVAIEQLRYIAKDSDIDYIKDGKTLEEKQKRFLEFWKKRSPNPNAQRNIRMEEYYARVDYANKHFSHYIEGWKTDMGMVYIIFGAPSSVDRHPYDMDSKPYEIWSYYELNHQFVFVDETGFGDYHLTTPIWDVWRRPDD